MKSQACSLRLLDEPNIEEKNPNAARELLKIMEETEESFDLIIQRIDKKMRLVESDYYEGNPKYNPLQTYLERILNKKLEIPNMSDLYEITNRIGNLGEIENEK